MDITEAKIYFDIDSRLLLQLGEKLVTDISIALAELIKNSYDAGATEATIIMKNINKPGGTICIKDNGSGMTSSTFKKTWMRIATDYKVKNPYTLKYNRKKVGEKGIGRFACRRLAQQLAIETVGEKENGEKEYLKAFFDWDSFSSGINIKDIPIKVETRIVDKQTETYTDLTLIKTRDSWNEKAINSMKRQLNNLFTPVLLRRELEYKGYLSKDDPGFKQNFIIEGKKEEEEEMSESLFKNAWGKIYGFVNKNGSADYKIQKIKRVKGKNTFNYERDANFRYLKDCEFIIYLFKWGGKLFQNSDWKEREAKNILKEKGGIKLFVDNVRIFGYGDKGDDWLKLDKDKAAAITLPDEEVLHFSIKDRKTRLYIPPNDSVFGYIIVETTHNPQLEITADREQLIKNDAFNELKKFVRLGIDFAALIYTNELEMENRKKQAVKDAKKKKEEEELRKKREKDEKEIQEQTKEIEKLIKEAHEMERAARNERFHVEQKRREIETSVRKMEKQTNLQHFNDEETLQKLIEEENVAFKQEQETYSKTGKIREETYQFAIDLYNKLLDADQKYRDELLIDQQRKQEQYEHALRMFRALATIGISISFFEHEVGALLKASSDLRIVFNTLKKSLNDKDRDFCEKKLNIYFRRLDVIEDYGGFLGIILGHIRTIEKEKHQLKTFIDQIYNPFREFFEEKSIEFENIVPSTLSTPPIHKSELASILFNLLSNAYKALKGQPNRKIRVEGYEDSRNLYIQFLDSGKGLEKENWDIVFEPFITFTPPDDIFGAGTGLGLTIVKDIIQGYGGDIRFKDPPEDWKTCMIIELTKEDNNED